MKKTSPKRISVPARKSAIRPACTRSQTIAPKVGVSVAALEKLGCESGKVLATPEARRIIAESAAQLDSFGDAQNFLKANAGIDVSVSTMTGLTHAAAEKTRQAWMDDKLIENPSARPAQKLPKDAKYVDLTMVVTVDGIGAPCTHADTEGIKGKNGDERRVCARSRSSQSASTRMSTRAATVCQTS